jgi:hypothetical protein
MIRCNGALLRVRPVFSVPRQGIHNLAPGNAGGDALRCNYLPDHIAGICLVGSLVARLCRDDSQPSPPMVLPWVYSSWFIVIVWYYSYVVSTKKDLRNNRYICYKL